jgi:hypothetical protein
MPMHRLDTMAIRPNQRNLSVGLVKEMIAGEFAKQLHVAGHR